MRLCISRILFRFAGVAGLAALLAPVVSERSPFALIVPAQAQWFEPNAAGLVADAGYDRHAKVGQTVQLDASRSLRLDGAALTYGWTLEKKPSGSLAKLSDATAARPTATIDAAGDYQFAVTVRAAGSSQTATARVVVSTVGVAPVADAGLSRKVAVGETLALDGSKSFDADGDAITYAWTLVKRPWGSKAALSSPADMRPELKVDVAGAYVAELRVTDATGKVGAPARVTISTGADAPGRASAGPAQTLAVGATARFDADGTWLPSGVPGVAAFTLISAPAGSRAQLGTGLDARRTLTPDLSGDYVVQTLVSRGTGADSDEHGDNDDLGLRCHARSISATVLATTGNVAPVADAGPEQKIAAGAVVALDGSRSTDANGDALTYRWALISMPAGSRAALDSPSAVRPKFTADLAGTYVAQLVVADAMGDSRPATVVVSTTRNAPSADAGPDAVGAPGSSVLLDGSASRNPGGAAVSPA